MKVKKQLIVYADMEGASGIFDLDIRQIRHGSAEWRESGRTKITSDVLAVCHAANDFGIDEILIYDGHYAGDPEPNILVDLLPKNAHLFDTWNRCFDWRRIRGQAEQNPFGLITVGQHSRNGEGNAYFPHTIQTPPIRALWCNGLHIAEIGMAVLSFNGVKFLANVGCRTSMKEALELSEAIVQIPVKDNAANWEPDCQETYPLIRNGVLEVLQKHDSAKAVQIDSPCKFSLELTDGYFFEAPAEFPWKGSFEKTVATWEAPYVEIGLELFNCCRSFIRKISSMREI